MTTANRIVVTTATAARTRTLGRRVARLLRPGDVLLLQGPLGAGKTTFAQGLGVGLGIEGPVRSPTFVLLARHDAGTGSMPLSHADLYRLDDPAQVEELALEEQAADGVLLVEWPERGLQALPPSHLLVVFELPADGGSATTRRITFVAAGERYQRVLDGMQAAGLGARA